MKKISMKFNRKYNSVCLSLNAINDFDQEKQVNALTELAKLFLKKHIYVVFLKIKDNKKNLDVPNADIVIIKSCGWYDILAIRLDNEHLDNMIRISTENVERTEIFYIDELSWNAFLEKKCILKDNEFEATLVINDNGQTFVSFSLEKYDINKVREKVKAILKQDE